jgi:integrase/recombinase XerC
MPRRCENTPGRGRNLPGGPDIASIAAESDSHASTPSDLGAYAELALHHTESQNLLGHQSAARIRRTLLRFASFTERAGGAHELRDITREDAQAFIQTATGTGQQPTTATMHHRRSSLRVLFRISRLLGWVGGDPTLDIELPPRSSLPCRPLTDDEIALCRSWSLQTLHGTRQPAAWALAETGARTSEIPHLLVSDVDHESGLVWVHGSSRLDPRSGQLSGWGAQQIARRVAELRGEPCARLVYGGAGGEAGQASSCIAISETLRRAGLGRERDVQPLSVAAWVGATILARGGSIDQVARALGMRSLDRAARLAGWDWRADPCGDAR